MTRDKIVKTGLLAAAAAVFGHARAAGAVTGYDRTVRLWEHPLFNTNDLAPALRDSLAAPVLVEMPRSTTWIRGTVPVSSGASVEGCGAAGYVICTAAPFKMLPGNELGPSWIRGLRLHAADGTPATSAPAFDTAASSTDVTQSVRGVTFSGIRPSGFALGWKVTGYQRCQWRDIVGHGCKRALDIVGRNVMTRFDSVTFEQGADRAVLIDCDTADTQAKPENTQFDGCQFLGYDYGIDRRSALFTVFRGTDLDGIRNTAFRWTDDTGGIVFDAGYVNVKQGGTGFYGAPGQLDNDVTIRGVHVFGEGGLHGVYVERRNGVHVTHNRFTGFTLSDITVAGACDDTEISWNKCLSDAPTYSIDAPNIGPNWQAANNRRAKPARLPNGTTR